MDEKDIIIWDAVKMLPLDKVCKLIQDIRLDVAYATCNDMQTRQEILFHIDDKTQKIMEIYHEKNPLNNTENTGGEK